MVSSEEDLLLLLRRLLATPTTRFAKHHVPVFNAFAMVLTILAPPLVLLAVAVTFVTSRLELAALVAAVVLLAADRHFGRASVVCWS